MSSKVDKLYSKSVEDENGCWLFQGTVDELGYGRIQIDKRRYKAHRLSYELMVTDIPEGLVIDHLCRTRSCINPYHMEPVPQSVNATRGNKARSKDRTHCKHGHELTDENTYNMGNLRRCKTCLARNGAKWYSGK